MKTKNTLRSIALTVICAMASIGLAHASITASVTPSEAPNAFGSPSYSLYVANATFALENGLMSYGTPGTPSFYQAAVTPLPVYDNIVTGFNSWDGQADPGSAFGPAFANELGNRLLFGIDIQGNGNKISIDNLSFSATSTDPSDTLGFSFGAGSYNYSSDYVGIIYGTGGGPDTFITSGPSSQLVDAIVGRGSGNAPAAYETDPGANDQERINNALLSLDTPFTFTGQYFYTGNELAAATVTFTPGLAVPEPSTIAMSGISGGIFILFILNRKRNGLKV